MKNKYEDKARVCLTVYFGKLLSEVNRLRDDVDSIHLVNDSIRYTDTEIPFVYILSNCAVNFEIEELPDWEFRIETTLGQNTNSESIQGMIYAKIKDDRKFNEIFPFDYILSEAWIIAKKDDELFISIGSAPKFINFALSEPELAYCRDYFGWDYNFEYHPKEEAKTKYNEIKQSGDIKVKKMKPEYCEQDRNFFRLMHNIFEEIRSADDGSKT